MLFVFQKTKQNIEKGDFIRENHIMLPVNVKLAIDWQWSIFFYLHATSYSNSNTMENISPQIKDISFNKLNNFKEI